MLCTLLIGNAFCMESLQIFIDIVTAGEIINQAICTGPRLLEIAGRLTPLLKIIIMLLRLLTASAWC